MNIYILLTVILVWLIVLSYYQYKIRKDIVEIKIIVCGVDNELNNLAHHTIVQFNTVSSQIQALETKK